MMLRIKIIDFKDTYPLRSKVLRPGKPVSTCAFVDDDCKETFHFGIFKENELIGVCSFLKCNNDNFNAENVYQLRGMAIDDKYQKKGIGFNLLVHAEAYLKRLDSILIWCNARVSAISFYEKNGFTIKGDEFEIPDVGLHKVMYKVL